ncbi:hypothetical protein IEE_01934 [Bacillus cereus BAG5X1-1]|uniref:Uncharacterized protein n=1 Tax=Bacillus cereus BAG5X1-1 TaxID=1053189 RepID=J8B3W5_BACCE|nr:MULTISPECIES: hypothetical protein [Bacillus cereus group]EJQ46435.1 hypothetical protein IEE_01934 [Bacillus cereus BAG5X1-1]WJE24837.1 hypothetical protein QRE65_23885 [Bacillus cereus]
MIGIFDAILRKKIETNQFLRIENRGAFIIGNRKEIGRFTYDNG